MNEVKDNYISLTNVRPFRGKLNSNNFIGPNSITLQKSNLMKSDNQNLATVLEDYTVTEKADGARKLLFISATGRIYLINTNMKIEFTGIKSNNKDIYNSIIDGEHVPYGKDKVYINMYLAFDLYYLNGKDFRSFPLIENDLSTDKHYRYISLRQTLENIKSQLTSPTYKFNLDIQTKDFELTNNKSDHTIFDACTTLLTKINDGMSLHETDGIIFTPQYLPVGCKIMSHTPPNKKVTWFNSFKWKPPEFNTIDFFVETVKHNGDDVINIKPNLGISLDSNAQNMEYKTVLLKISFNPDSDGYPNPLSTLINASYEDIDMVQQARENAKAKKFRRNGPALFYPTSPYDNETHRCNIMYKVNGSSTEKGLYAEDGDLIEDKSIVEFKYVEDNEKFWKWVPIRVRHDKTYKFRTSKDEFGNGYKTANSNWQSIHNPITSGMLQTGEGIHADLSGDDTYYRKGKNKDSKTQNLRNFHNWYVKTTLIRTASNAISGKPKLIDLAVGMGGDLNKWIQNGIGFVFGVDLSRDNIENKLKGACARYLDAYYNNNDEVPKAMFLVGDSSKLLSNGDGYNDERSLQIQNAIMGKGDKDLIKLGKGV